MSAIVSPNVYLDRFYYKLSPNIYVFLIGESGVKKGPPINLAASLVKQCDCTRVIKGRSTVEGIIKYMGKAVTLNSGKVLADSRVFVAMSEFGSALIHNIEGILQLTDLYDTHYNEDWDVTLSSVPINKLIKPCITMIAASNETNLSATLPSEAVDGGFIARTSIIEENNPRTLNSLAFKPNKTLNTGDLCKYLFELRELKGEFNYKDGSDKLYDEWYKSFMSVKRDDKTGTVRRIGDTILKISMLIHLSKSPDLFILKDDIEESIEVCLTTIPGMKRITMGYGKGELSAATRIILFDLVRKYPEGIKRSRLLSNHWGEFDSQNLDRIMDNLDQSQAISIQMVTGSNGKKDYEYTMKDNVYKEYTKYLNKKGESYE